MRRSIALLLTLALTTAPARAEPETETTAEAIVVTATRRPDLLFETPASATAIDEEALAHERAVRTIPEALLAEPSVMVQKTAQGQASPYIRGFTGFRTLLLVDGVRLNNSVFREGPNQYWGLVDPLTVSSLELVTGPGSVLFGSDAVGGTVNAVLRSAPRDRKETGFGGRIYARGSTAEDSITGRAEAMAVRAGDLGVLAGVTVRDFGDLRNGDHVGTLDESGYGEWSADLRVDWRVAEQLDLTLVWQRVDQDDVPRTHSTVFGESWRGTEVGTDRKRDTDELRQLVFLRGTWKPVDVFDRVIDRVVVTLSWQELDEEEDRIRSSGRRDIAGFDVDTFGVSAQVEAATSIGEVTAGVEWYHDDVSLHRRRIEADGTKRTWLQGQVADDATYDLLGVYLQDEVEVVDGLTLVGGARLTHAAADANEVLDPVTDRRTSIDDDWTDVVGSLRFVAEPVTRWRIFGGVSQGFRAPNLSDLTRLDSARSGEIETPSPDLDPENFTTFELGVRSRQDGWSFEVSGYHTEIDDMITRFPTGREIDGEIEVRKANVGDGWVRGFEARAEVDLTREWSVYGAVAWTDGEADVFPTSERRKERETLSRLAPAQGIAGIRWRHETGRLWAGAEVRFADAQDDLSTRDENDTQRIPPGGTPGWSAIHLRAGGVVAEDLRFFVALENLFDTDYRVHGSGVNAPGRNLVVGFDLTF